ncbi:MAG TPA: HNH endonuclease [Nevskiaceae bacterium]|nr:HNH endonuclease [Nevskiaceae bacterium]
MSRYYSNTTPRAPRSLLLNEAGLPVQWMTWQEAALSVTDPHKVWSAGETVVTLHGGTQRSGARSVLVLPAVIALRMPRGVPVRERAPLCNRLLFERDRYVCMYCGMRCREQELSRDHIYPRCRGGADAWENVVAACKACNQRKGGRSPEEARMPLLAVPYAPNHAEHLILEGRHILADQMDFLLAAVPAARRDHYTVAVRE